MANVFGLAGLNLCRPTLDTIKAFTKRSSWVKSWDTQPLSMYSIDFIQSINEIDISIPNYGKRALKSKVSSLYYLKSRTTS